MEYPMDFNPVASSSATPRIFPPQQFLTPPPQHVPHPSNDDAALRIVDEMFSAKYLAMSEHLTKSTAEYMRNYQQEVRESLQQLHVKIEARFDVLSAMLMQNYQQEVQQLHSQFEAKFGVLGATLRKFQVDMQSSLEAITSKTFEVVPKQEVANPTTKTTAVIGPHAVTTSSDTAIDNLPNSDEVIPIDDEDSNDDDLLLPGNLNKHEKDLFGEDFRDEEDDDSTDHGAGPSRRGRRVGSKNKRPLKSDLRAEIVDLKRKLKSKDTSDKILSLRNNRKR